MAPGKKAVQFVANEEQVAAALREYPHVLFGRAMHWMDLYMLEFVTRTLVKLRLSGRPGLNRITGHLAGSFRKSVTGENLADLVWEAYTPAKYAWPHEPRVDGSDRSYTSSTGKVWTMPGRLRFRETYVQDAPRRKQILSNAVREAAKLWSKQKGAG